MIQFKRAIQALCDAQVDFVVIGGLAASLHGSARVTFDLDICYSQENANLKKLVTALAPFRPRPRGFPDELPFVWDAAMLRNASVLTLKTEIGDIDLLSEVAGVGTYLEAFVHSIPTEAYERSFRSLDLDALIASKKAAGRRKDQEALEELESLRESGAP